MTLSRPVTERCRFGRLVIDIRAQACVPYAPS